MSWRVEKLKFVLKDGTRMRAGCHHGYGRSTACGGCYARLRILMCRIVESPQDAVHLIQECRTAIRAEKKPVKP